MEIAINSFPYCIQCTESHNPEYQPTIPLNGIHSPNRKHHLHDASTYLKLLYSVTVFMSKYIQPESDYYLHIKPNCLHGVMRTHSQFILFSYLAI